jgi:hypothetical protein
VIIYKEFGRKISQTKKRTPCILFDLAFCNVLARMIGTTERNTFHPIINTLKRRK